jgi:hypothetical protein
LRLSAPLALASPDSRPQVHATSARRASRTYLRGALMGIPDGVGPHVGTSASISTSAEWGTTWKESISRASGLSTTRSRSSALPNRWGCASNRHTVVGDDWCSDYRAVGCSSSDETDAARSNARWTVTTAAMCPRKWRRTLVVRRFTVRLGPVVRHYPQSSPVVANVHLEPGMTKARERLWSRRVGVFGVTSAGESTLPRSPWSSRPTAGSSSAVVGAAPAVAGAQESAAWLLWCLSSVPRALRR